MSRLSRRLLLGTGLAAFAVPVRASSQRIVTTELVLTETALALGLSPVAAGNLPLYRRLVGEPALPAGVQDLGPLNEPNMELLVWLKPDLILAANWQSAPQAALARIAQVEWLQTLPFEHPPLDLIRALATDIGAVTGHGDEAASLITALDQALVPAPSGKPVVLAKLFEDGRNALVFGPGSMVGDVAAALGMANAVPDAGPFGAMPVGLDMLLITRAPILSLGPVPEGALLTRLRASGGLRVVELPPVFPAGGIPSALRLAQAIPVALKALA